MKKLILAILSLAACSIAPAADHGWPVSGAGGNAVAPASLCAAKRCVGTFQNTIQCFNSQSGQWFTIQTCVSPQVCTSTNACH